MYHSFVSQACRHAKWKVAHRKGHKKAVIKTSQDKRRRRTVVFVPPGTDTSVIEEEVAKKKLISSSELRSQEGPQVPSKPSSKDNVHSSDCSVETDLSDTETICSHETEIPQKTLIQVLKLLFVLVIS